jgi:uncharacterized damage-inducible protein DinB
MRLAIRSAGQIRRSLFHEGWHGPAIFEVLRDVDAEMAAAITPVASHSIWMLVRHMRAWQEIAFEALSGKPLPPQEFSDKVGWEPFEDLSEQAWRRELARFRESGDRLSQRTAALEDKRLNEQVPGRAYDFGHMLLGIASHNTYHCGQIVLLLRYLHLQLKQGEEARKS